MADEVEGGEYRLVLGPAKPAAQLLEEDRRGLGGTEEENGVDVGKVNSLVEQVNGEEDLQSASLQSLQSSATLGLRGLAGDRLRGDSSLLE